MKTLETMPPSAVQALSTPSELDYASIVKTIATRKSSNGQTITTQKGKVSLLTACIDKVRSDLGLPEYVTSQLETLEPAYGKTGERIRIPVHYVESLKREITALFDSRVLQMRKDAENIGANERQRDKYLTGKIDEETGEISVALNSDYKWTKGQSKNSPHYKWQVATMLNAAKKRKLTLESKPANAERDDAVAKCQRKINHLQKEYDVLFAKDEAGK
jgi:hypothetical protein